MNKSSINILVTGGAGYIGSHVCHLLIDKGYKVTCIDSLINGNKKLLPKKVDLKVFDIGDKNKVSKLIQSKKFDLVMHFAGLIKVDESMKKPKKYRKYNYFKAKSFLETCFDNNLKNIIFSSTAAVYGNTNNKVKENYKKKTLNPYASSKLELENFIKNSSKIHKSKFIILRYFNVAGSDRLMRTGLISKRSTHLIKIISEVVVGKRKVLKIYGDNYDTPDGTPIRDFVHVSDLADIHLLVMKHLLSGGNSEIYNCGYGKGYSVMDVVKKVNEIQNIKLKFKISSRRPGDSKFVVSNTNKFMKAFNWKPKYNNLRKILQSSIDWEKKIKN